MKQIYKMTAIVAFGIMLITAQDAVAQRNGGTRGNSENAPGRERGNDRGKGSDFGKDNPGKKYGHEKDKGGKGAPYGNHKGGHGYGNDHRNDHGQHVDLNIRVGGDNYHLGQLHTYKGGVYQIRRGNFYMRNLGRWVGVMAPIGMRVTFLPYGAQIIQTRRGVIYEYAGNYFVRVHRGYEVIPPPGRMHGHGHYERW